MTIPSDPPVYEEIAKVERALAVEGQAPRRYTNDARTRIAETVADLEPQFIRGIAGSVLRKWDRQGLPPLGIWLRLADDLRITAGRMRTAIGSPPGCGSCMGGALLLLVSLPHGNIEPQAYACECDAGKLTGLPSWGVAATRWAGRVDRSSFYGQGDLRRMHEVLARWDESRRGAQGRGEVTAEMRWTPPAMPEKGPVPISNVTPTLDFRQRAAGEREEPEGPTEAAAVDPDCPF